MRYDKQNRKLEALRERAEQSEAEAEKQHNYANEMRSALESTMHEVRRLTSSLAGYANTLLKQAEKQSFPRPFQDAIETVFHTSGMISARLAYTDVQLNPQSIVREPRIPTGLFKKFEKARYVLAQKAANKKIKIRLAESRATFQAITVFELIPFLILDNAIKYAPPEHEVDVTFTENENSIRAEVTSLGPQLSPDEIARIFEKGFRGSYALKGYSGDGLGLYVTRQIAGFHERMAISADSERKVRLELNGVKFSDFRITLEIEISAT